MTQNTKVTVNSNLPLPTNSSIQESAKKSSSAENGAKVTTSTGVSNRSCPASVGKMSCPSTSNQPSQNIHPADETDMMNSQISLPDLHNSDSPKEQRPRNKPKKRKQQSSSPSGLHNRFEVLAEHAVDDMYEEENSQDGGAHGVNNQKSKKAVAQIHHHTEQKQQNKSNSKSKPELLRKQNYPSR